MVSLVAILAPGASLSIVPCFARERDVPAAQVSVHTGREACAVELDSAPAGKTNARGDLVLQDVDPSDHYIHVRCPGQPELGYFISPRAGENAEIRRKPDSRPAAAAPTRSALEAAEAKIQLRQLVLKAVQLRAAGRFEEAVQNLHDATSMDPENSDLHRELGITFLLAKEWKRARVEMLQAIKHDPSDADAHSGLGYALEKLGELETALKEYRIATHLDPDDPSYRQHYVDAVVKLAARQAEKKK